MSDRRTNLLKELPEGPHFFPKNTIQSDFHDSEETLCKLYIDVEIGLGKGYD